MDQRTYELYVDIFTPETIPLGRLSAYMAKFAELLGHESKVHLKGLEPGSLRVFAEVAEIAAPKVRGRMQDLAAGRGPKIALQAVQELDDLLAEDNAIGHVSSGASALIVFPGRLRHNELVTGPVVQAGTLDGEIIQIGGRDESINVHLKLGGEVVKCVTTKVVARRLAAHLFGGPVRVMGEGTWMRKERGGWDLKKFVISDFVVLDETPLALLFEGLRQRLVPPDGGRQNPADLMMSLRAED